MLERETVQAIARTLHQLDRQHRGAEREAVLDALFALRRLCWSPRAELPPRLRRDRIVDKLRRWKASAA
jgi:hypothetical protein